MFIYNVIELLILIYFCVLSLCKVNFTKESTLQHLLPCNLYSKLCQDNISFNFKLTLYTPKELNQAYKNNPNITLLNSYTAVRNNITIDQIHVAPLREYIKHNSSNIKINKPYNVTVTLYNIDLIYEFTISCLMDVYEAYKLLRKPPVTGWTNSLLFRLIISSLVGLCIGMINSLIINIALVEIAVSRLFAAYFGIIFMATGGIIIYRIKGASIADLDARKRQKYFIVFGSLVILSGFLCMFIKPSLILKLPKLLNILLFGLLGMSISFAIIFSAIDLTNIAFSFCSFTRTSSPIENNTQIYLIILIAIFMGLLFGLMFGLLDVTNEISYHVKLSLLKQESISYPIAGLVGGLAGFVNEYLRIQEEGYIQLKRAEYDTAI